jgi:hypothetical protein
MKGEYLKACRAQGLAATALILGAIGCGPTAEPNPTHDGVGDSPSGPSIDGSDAPPDDSSDPDDSGRDALDTPEADAGPVVDAVADAVPGPDSSPDPDAGDVLDAVATPDVDVVADAAPRPDASPVPDAGDVLDAVATPDVDAVPDASPGVDASPDPDAGDTFDAAAGPDASPNPDATVASDAEAGIDGSSDGDGGGNAEGAATADASDATPTISTCDPFATYAVGGGKYAVQTNEWNSTLTQCLSIDDTGFTVTQASFAMPPGAPATYPSIFTGCHWGYCTPSIGLPAQVSALPPVTSSWSTTQPLSGTYDVAYDVWFNSTPTTSGQPDRAELMIWIAEAGLVSPAGSPLGTAAVGGATWIVWAGPMPTWNYIAYVRTTPVTSVENLDIGAFISDAVARGAVDPASYLIAVEAGFEIWQGGQGLATNDFNVDVGGGGTGP